jgi:type I restriction enzyme S subunit
MRAQQIKLGDVLELERIPVDIDPDTEYRQIGIRSFGNGIFHREPCKGSELSRLNYFVVNPERLVVSNIMAWEGAIGISTQKEEGFVGSARFLSYRAIGDVDIRYLNYYFRSPGGLSLVRTASTGTVTRNQTLSPKNLEGMRVPLPKIDEQRRVADKLEASFGHLSAVADMRERVLNLRINLREALIHSALHGTVSPVRVGDIVTLTRAETTVAPDRHYRPIGMRSFGKGIIRYASALGDELSKLRYYTFPQNALALSNIKAWEGAISVTTEKDIGHVASNRFLFYLPVGDDVVNVSYLRHYFLSRAGITQISAKSPGGADRNRTLGIKGFESIELPLPPWSVQDRIASTLDKLAARLEPAYADRSLTALRPALLDAAFSGRL